MLEGLSVKVLKMFRNETYMELDKIDSQYAFDRKCLIECNTEKLKSSKRGVYIKRTRSAG